MVKSIETHHKSSPNYFDNRSTEATGASFNVKVQGLRSKARGVRAWSEWDAEQCFCI